MPSNGELHVVESVRKECQAGLPVIVPDLGQVQWVRLVASPSSADPRFLALDAGERDTISEALRDEADLVLIDERLGRNLAEYYGLRVVGTLGTLLKAKKNRRHFRIPANRSSIARAWLLVFGELDPAPRKPCRGINSLRLHSVIQWKTADILSFSKMLV